MPLVVDTGVLYALADSDDRWHARAVELLEQCGDILLAPITVLPEACYLLATRLGARAEQSLLASVAAGEIAVDHLGPEDLSRASEIMVRYPSIGFVDATVVALAERLKVTAIATTDRRHFEAIRPKHCRTFRLLP